ncbi:hypothetical protein PSCICJ_01370 [Pseudomonas cichorii]|nr:hypothetical protein [Pseudomonas cichorii]GFM64019.1 hypothetical protein PSCICJ_01370 [Pseudomonas cichorii]
MAQRTRNTFMLGVLAACTALMVTAAPVFAQNQAAPKAETLTLTSQWDKTFPQSNKVDHQKVTFKNR